MTDRVTAARLAIAVVLALLYALLVLREYGRQPPAFSEDGRRTLTVATRLAEGRGRWGITEYTHHPLGSAYALVPMLRLAPTVDPKLVPASASALAAAAALAVLLVLAPWALWPAVLAWFAALLRQPGFILWVGNAWQHSWNFSVVFVAVALGCTVRRAAPWLLALGVLAGWLGYDFIFFQVATIFAVRLATWSQGPRGRALADAFDDTVAFATGVLLAVAAHVAQNVLYFSSGVVAVQDFLSGVFIRVNNSDYAVETLAQRLAHVAELARGYAWLFSLPLWSHLPSLAAAAAIGALSLAVALRLAAARRRVVAPLLACWAALLGGVLAWWFVAPGHALAHPHLFPRLLFVPPLGALACAVRILSVAPPPDPPAWRPRWRHLLLVLLIVALQPSLLGAIGAALDEHVYTNVWANVHSSPRPDRLSVPYLPATSPQAPGPALWKGGMLLVGGVNAWGVGLDNHHWEPGSAPWVYEERFAGPARITDVLLRYFGPAKGRGALLDFTLEVTAEHPLRLDPSTCEIEITEQGYLRGLRYHLRTPVTGDGLRLTIRSADGTPAVTDLLAFGYPTNAVP